MLRFIATFVLQLLAAAAGLFLASVFLPGFHIEPMGFVVSVLFFVVANFILEPLIIKLAVQYVPAVRGGVALATTFVGLFLTVTFTDGIRIDDLTTWILAPLIVWLCILLASVILPLFLFKKTLQHVKDNDNN